MCFVAWTATVMTMPAAPTGWQPQGDRIGVIACQVLAAWQLTSADQPQRSCPSVQGSRTLVAQGWKVAALGVTIDSRGRRGGAGVAWLLWPHRAERCTRMITVTPDVGGLGLCLLLQAATLR